MEELKDEHMMKTKMKYQDLVYFGYTWEDDSKSLETEFMNTIKERFGYVELNDSFDEIKGYRQGFYLKEGDEDSYKAWILANGWYTCSMTMTLTRDIEELNRLIVLAKEEYPNKYKK